MASSTLIFGMEMYPIIPSPFRFNTFQYSESSSSCPPALNTSALMGWLTVMLSLYARAFSHSRVKSSFPVFSVTSLYLLMSLLCRYVFHWLEMAGYASTPNPTRNNRANRTVKTLLLMPTSFCQGTLSRRLASRHLCACTVSVSWLPALSSVTFPACFLCRMSSSPALSHAFRMLL